MKISEILESGRRGISFEVFPPKSSSSLDSIRAATEQIAALRPTYMSVTYGAGGGTSKYTLDIAKNIEYSCSVPTLAHLTCVSSTRATVAERISELSAAGIQNIMALRGDMQRDREMILGEYHHAVDLIRELRESGYDFCIGGACYPEVHPESDSAESDIFYLKEKVDAGCSFLTTQMFFDNGLYYSFLDRASRAGIGVPIVPGIMPITAISQVERARTLSGSYMPKEFLALAEQFGDDPAAMCQAGIEYASAQIEDLFGSGVKNVHVYTMNKPLVAESIMKNLCEMIDR